MNRQIDDLLEAKIPDTTARLLETIVISLAEEIEEEYNSDTNKDFYEIMQAHIYDAYELGKRN